MICNFILCLCLFWVATRREHYGEWVGIVGVALWDAWGKVLMAFKFDCQTIKLIKLIHCCLYVCKSNLAFHMEIEWQQNIQIQIVKPVSLWGSLCRLLSYIMKLSELNAESF